MSQFSGFFVSDFGTPAQCNSVGFDSFKTLPSINALLKFNHFNWFAEAFYFFVFACSLQFYAVIHHAVEHAGAATNTEIINYANFAGAPVKRVGWAGFYAEFALATYAGELVYADFAIFEEFFYAGGA